MTAMLNRRSIFLLLLAASFPAIMPAPGQSNSGSKVADSAPASASGTDTVLLPADLEKIIPSSVFFHGQSAPVQQRNSGGVRFADGAILFATNVDASGYSSGIQEKYQAYLITEVPITIAQHGLATGAYGIGFVGDSSFVVMDVGGKELFTVPSQHDTALRRPTPVQVRAGASPHTFLLYSGRRYVEFSRPSAPAH